MALVFKFALILFLALDAGESYADSAAEMLKSKLAQLKKDKEDEKLKDTQVHIEKFRSAKSNNEKISAALTLASYFWDVNETLSFQYIKLAESITDPFDSELETSRNIISYYNIRSIFSSQKSAKKVVKEAEKLFKKKLPKKLRKSTLEMILEAHWDLGNKKQFLKYYKKYSRGVSHFKKRESFVQNAALAYLSQKKYRTYYKTLESLASRYPATPGSIWAFERLNLHTVKREEFGKLPRYYFNLSFLRKLNRNSILDPKLKDRIFDIVQGPIKLRKRSRPTVVNEFQMINVLVRIREYDAALAQAEKVISNPKLSEWQRRMTTKWLAHINGLVGNHDKAAEYYEISFNKPFGRKMSSSPKLLLRILQCRKNIVKPMMFISS